MKALLVVLACVTAALAEDKRVVGGVPARKGGNPYMAAIFTSSGTYKCSGVLVHRRWVATAAHCVADATRGSLKVVLGEYSLTRKDGTEQTFEVSARAMIPKRCQPVTYPAMDRFPPADCLLETNWKITHEWNPGYQTTSGYPNNIALLKLNRNANINAAVRPIAMPTTSQGFAGETCAIVGWGKTSVSGSHSDILNTARAIPITNDACVSAWADVRGASIFSTNVCAQNNGIQTCNGDSGSPLVCGNRFAGIASWGEKSCGGTHPFIFTRVSSYVNWINSIIAKY